MSQQAHEHAAEHSADSHGGTLAQYFYVFLALCVLTTASFFTYSDYWPFHDQPKIGWAFMMAVSCTKAMLVILFFMHVKYEANWKYVLTIPAGLMSVFLILMLVPDIGNREKKYCDVNNAALAEEMQGRLLFLKHETMISRFHAMIEIACSESKGQVKLADFQQGPALWHKIEVPKLSFKDGQWREMDQTEYLPHRPDAFFSLSFPSDPAGREPLHFFYEADRHRTDRAFVAA